VAQASGHVSLASGMGLGKHFGGRFAIGSVKSKVKRREERTP
jgi:hypothetical protein